MRCISPVTRSKLGRCSKLALLVTDRRRSAPVAASSLTSTRPEQSSMATSRSDDTPPTGASSVSAGQPPTRDVALYSVKLKSFTRPSTPLRVVTFGDSQTLRSRSSGPARRPSSVSRFCMSSSAIEPVTVMPFSDSRSRTPETRPRERRSAPRPWASRTGGRRPLEVRPRPKPPRPRRLPPSNSVFTMQCVKGPWSSVRGPTRQRRGRRCLSACRLMFQACSPRSVAMRGAHCVARTRSMSVAAPYGRSSDWKSRSGKRARTRPS